MGVTSRRPELQSGPMLAKWIVWLLFVVQSTRCAALQQDWHLEQQRQQAQQNAAVPQHLAHKLHSKLTAAAQHASLGQRSAHQRRLHQANSTRNTSAVAASSGLQQRSPLNALQQASPGPATATMQQPLNTAINSRGSRSNGSRSNYSSNSSNPSNQAACGPGSGMCPRIEINEIDKLPQGNHYKVLLILTWQALYKVEADSPLSFFQVSGIHGAPYTAYNNTVGEVSNRTTGYCFHRSTLFPTWHRASVWHFEQIMIAKAKAVAQTFVNSTERQAYLRTAQTLRVPFFDWANEYLQSDFPQILVNRTVLVDDPATPDVALVQIDNPFFEYVVPRVVDSGIEWPVSIPAGQATVRDPANEDDNYITNQAAFVASMRQNQPAFADQVASFLAADTWGCLYNGDCGLGFTDLETIHNNVHGAVGGTFGLVPTSGFDPMFFMHHAAIDRLFWLWQQRFPRLWVAPRNESGNFYTSGDQMFDRKTELAPFWRNATSFFNSDDVRNISNFGYYYRPPAGSGDPRAAELLLRRRSLKALQGKHTSWNRYSLPWVQALDSYNHGYNGYRWQVNFEGCPTAQLGQPWYIHVLLKASSRGPVEQGRPWQLQPGYCGSYYQLAMVGTGHMPNNSPTLDVTIDVTRCLQQAGVHTDAVPAVPGRPDLGPAQPLPVLEQLLWVATDRAGQDKSMQFDFGTPQLTWSWLENGVLTVGAASS